MYKYLNVLASVFILLMAFNLEAKEVVLKKEINWDSAAHTQEMSHLLDKVNSQINRGEDYYVDNSLRAKEIYNIAKTQLGSEKLETLLEVAVEYLNAGELDSAISLLLNEILNSSVAKKNEKFEREARFILAAVYFRKGEKSNCMHFNNSDSCIFPLKKGGIHREKKWAKESIVVLNKLLKNKKLPYAEQLKYQWLLNISYMALGEFPNQVPKRYLLKAEKILDKTKLLKFENVSKSLGVDASFHAGGAIMDDFNNDGFLDIIASSFHLGDPLSIYLNNGKEGFNNVSETSGLKGITGGLHISQIDYDNDGNLDFYVNRGAWRSDLSATAGNYPNSLIRNNGNGTFTDVTKISGLLSLLPTQSSVWADFDNDGFVDIFVGHEITTGNPGTKNWELFKNLGDGTFNEISKTIKGIELKDVWIKGVAVGDFNNDGFGDLFISIYGGSNKLFIAQGAWNFIDASSKAGISDPQFSFSTSIFDFNNDGLEDILVYAYDYNQTDISDVVLDYIGQKKKSGKSSNPALYRNNGDGTFTNVTSQVGLDYELLAMGTNVGDINNDGWLDIYVGTGTPQMYFLVPNRMFLNQGGKRFVDVTEMTGLGHLQKGHAISFGDFDNDGDQDIYAVMGGAYSDDKFENALFMNKNNSNKWIKMLLVGTKSNRSAVGARVKIVTKNKKNKLRSIYRTISSGSSFGSNSFLLHIGLDDALSIESIEVRWPDGSEQIKIDISDVKINNRYRIKEGVNRAEMY